MAEIDDLGEVLKDTLIEPDGHAADFSGGELTLAAGQLSDVATALVYRAPCRNQAGPRWGHVPVPHLVRLGAAPRTAFPAHPATLASYVAHGAALGRKPATIARTLSSIRVAHRKAALPVPNTEDALEALRG